MRLIDADYLIRIINGYEFFVKSFSQLQKVAINVDDVIEEINQAPTIDAVEVVRCKDCKHRTELPYVDKDTHEPIYDCGYNISAIWGEENGYCNHGERK